MKYFLLIILFSFQSKTYGQIAKIELAERGNRKSVFIAVQLGNGKTERYGAGCGFKDVTKLNDSTRLSLIQSLFALLDDTTYCYGDLKPLSYRYSGRYNTPPKSTLYNIQVAALVLINYIAFSSDAVEYSPFPVLINKKSKKEFTTTGKELKAVIRDYQKWFKKIKRNGFNNYPLPLINKKYEWYGSLYSKQRIFAKTSEWGRFYDCPVLIKQED